MELFLLFLTDRMHSDYSLNCIPRMQFISSLWTASMYISFPLNCSMEEYLEVELKTMDPAHSSTLVQNI